MLTFSPSHLRILHALEDGSYQSGTTLGNLLSISRTAVWKQIKHLIEIGVPIQRHLKRGYKLSAPLILLNEDKIRQHLQRHGVNLPLDFYLFSSIDSTNKFLKTGPSSNIIRVAAAELQTAGRGRFGREWYSPFGENIYCSIRWHFNGDLSRLSGLSLVVSLSIMATLEEMGLHENIHIKWPNDILWKDEKLCGNLIEVIAESNHAADVIIGVGINVNSNKNHHKDALLDRPWCSLHEITGKLFDRNRIIAHLLVHLNHFLMEFVQNGFSPFISKWQLVDYLKDQMITVSQPLGLLRGKANGVNEVGQLILIDEQGIKHYLSSGDTSLQI